MEKAIDEKELCKSIYIDAMSYLDEFFDLGGNSWDIMVVKGRVKAFTQLMAAKNIEIKVFIEAGFGVHEEVK